MQGIFSPLLCNGLHAYTPCPTMDILSLEVHDCRGLLQPCTKCTSGQRHQRRTRRRWEEKLWHLRFKGGLDHPQRGRAARFQSVQGEMIDGQHPFVLLLWDGMMLWWRKRGAAGAAAGGGCRGLDWGGGQVPGCGRWTATEGAKMLES